MASTLKVIIISGPRGSGKSTLIRLMATSLFVDDTPHYIRLVPVTDEPEPRLTLLGDLKSANLQSWKRVNYDATRIFEFLPECLTQIAEMRSSRTVLIEADADPNLRYAYPYDHRIFMMRSPETVEEVFRSPTEAATALKEVMDDTAAFASEMFGLFDPEVEDDAPASTQRVRRGRMVEERTEISAAQMRRFMNSPLGAEVASRIQLQPAYHGMMESDLILVNLAIGGSSNVVDRVTRQIQTMINRLSEGRMNKPVLFSCNPEDFADPLQNQLLMRVKSMLAD